MNDLPADDFALDTMTREESKDVYQLFLERTGRGSMIITSNRDTAEWLAMFDDMLLAQSAVDRFKNAAFDRDRGRVLSPAAQTQARGRRPTPVCAGAEAQGQPAFTTPLTSVT